MGLPHSPEARIFYRAGKQRFDDAQLLLQADRTTGAIYLAGYTIECLLKAVILDGVPSSQRRQLLSEFQGSRGHNLEWLGDLYRNHVRMVIPLEMTRHLTRLSSWSTDLRYSAGRAMRRDADQFMESVVTIADWIEGRL
jgi:hypothetical protein